MKKFILATIFLVFTLSGAAYSAPQEKEDHLCKAVIARLIYPQITAEINKYYEKILTDPPTYAPYYGTEVQCASDSTNKTSYSVTVVVSPYVGAHVSVGVDEIKFLISVTGDVKTVSFKHLEDFKLPPHMKNYYR